MTQEEIEQAMSDMLRQEIDNEILTELRVLQLVSQGWTAVAIEPTMDLSGAGEWLSTNMRGEWRLLSRVGMFSDVNDAMLFRLRWA